MKFTSKIPLFISYFIITTSAWLIDHVRGPENLDQRNRPSIPVESDIEKQRNRPTNIPRSIKNQYPDDLDYTYISNHIICRVNSESPLAIDVYGAIEDLYNFNEADNASCTTNIEEIDVLNHGQSCTTLVTYHSAKIGVCLTLMKEVDCNKVAGMAMMLVEKCRKKNDEVRAGGKVEISWGNVFVINSTVELKWRE